MKQEVLLDQFTSCKMVYTKSAHLLSYCVTTRVSVCKALVLSATFSLNIDVEDLNNAV